MGLSPTDHVILFPFPAKGHIKPFLCLARLLCNAGLRVTFLNTEHHHRNIHNLTHLAAQLPSLHFQSISDGLPPSEPQNLLDGKLFKSMPQVTKPLFRELLLSYDNGTSPITCVITDVILRFPMDVAQELGIPVFCFSTFSARFLFLYFSIPKLLEDGQIPYPVGNSNQQLHGIPGGEGLLRCKDLPGYWSVEAVAKHNPMNFVNQTLATSKSCGLILNTFEELEAPFVTSLSKIYNKVYTIGPIHSLLKNLVQSQCEFWKEDHSCLAWLDSQAPRSVMFISFGSLVKLTSSQLREFWNGLVNSGKAFLLVLRSDVLIEEAGEEDEKQRELVIREITMETKEEGRWVIVNWAPQEEVLSHEAIGGFLTHSGWNSTLESLAVGVRMISWPQIGDQPSNATWLTKVWKIGVQMEDLYDRSTVETMVRSIMEHQDQKMENAIAELAKLAKDRVSKDGTSYRNLQRLVEDIKEIKLN
ncbi:7-deoxyloganetic acid glucosyltransferase-like [Benincasa hispida]|uniref:7-deoxyloganetic acid glucosyltransferase-like n=1 Tax=Benincasa hispida TaxID=102211 RepID=UPI0018FF209C|nr:7-deoxyloganetic acid glucosyltransferase-like [Benincasa hispida]